MSNDPEGFYGKLGVQPTASAEEIKSAYRRLVKSTHPDSNPLLEHDDSWLKEINEAYSILGRPEKRVIYDVSASVSALVTSSGDKTSQPFSGIFVSQSDLDIHRATAATSASFPRRRIWQAISGLVAVAVMATVALILFRWQSSPTQFHPGMSFSDCYDCPSMMVLAPSSYLMGSEVDNVDAPKWSNPSHLVSIRRAIAVGRFLVTNQEFSMFLTAMLQKGWYDQRWAQTDQQTPDSHLLWRIREVLSENGFATHPATHVSWQGANAYVKWLSAKTGQPYRLLSEAEWEYAARAGTQTKFYFGDDVLKACEYANTADYSYTERHTNAVGIRCTDGYSETSPVGTFKPNAFGLYDMIGNVWEWVQDCWHVGYDGAPDDGSAWISGDACSNRVLRGQSFSFANWGEGVAVRSFWPANGQSSSIGFRVARELP